MTCGLQSEIKGEKTIWKKCPPGNCCWQHGWCGTGPDYCDNKHPKAALSTRGDGPGAAIYDQIAAWYPPSNYKQSSNSSHPSSSSQSSNSSQSSQPSVVIKDDWPGINSEICGQIANEGNMERWKKCGSGKCCWKYGWCGPAGNNDYCGSDNKHTKAELSNL